MGVQRAPLKVIAHNQSNTELNVFRGEPVVKLQVFSVADFGLNLNGGICLGNQKYFEKLQKKYQSGNERKKFKFNERPQ